MGKVLCIGHAAYDITMPVVKYPKENSKVRIGKTTSCSGGAATNAGFVLAKWDIETYIAAAVGNDEYGLRIIEEMQECGIHTDYVRISDSFETTTSYILASQETGSRTIIISRTKQTELTDVEFKIIPSAIIADGEELELTKKALKQFPNAISILDAGSLKPAIVSLASLVNYCITSRDFAEEYCQIPLDPTKKEDMIQCHIKMEQDFKTNVIITLGEYGSFTKYNGSYELVPSLHVKAVDTTGSGDIYHGAFLYFLEQGKSVLEAMRYANITGAIAATKLGRNHSIPELQEVLERATEDDLI